jgi:hypothetical protein
MVGWWAMVHCGLFEQLKTCWNVWNFGWTCPVFKDLLEYWFLFE